MPRPKGSGRFDYSSKEGRAKYQKWYREQHRERFRAEERERRFGVDLAAYAVMVTNQNNECDICHRPERATRLGRVKALAIDHNHTTGVVRGLLCSDCNTGLGKFGDDRDRLVNAIRYLDKHRVGVSAVKPLMLKGAV